MEADRSAALLASNCMIIFMLSLLVCEMGVRNRTNFSVIVLSKQDF